MNYEACPRVQSLSTFMGHGMYVKVKRQDRVSEWMGKLSHKRHTQPLRQYCHPSNSIIISHTNSSTVRKVHMQSDTN